MQQENLEYIQLFEYVRVRSSPSDFICKQRHLYTNMEERERKKERNDRSRTNKRSEMMI